MVFADAENVQPDLIREGNLVEEVAQEGGRTAHFSTLRTRRDGHKAIKTDFHGDDALRALWTANVPRLPGFSNLPAEAMLVPRLERAAVAPPEEQHEVAHVGVHRFV